jgi:hypothetical protein
MSGGRECLAAEKPCVSKKDVAACEAQGDNRARDAASAAHVAARVGTTPRAPLPTLHAAQDASSLLEPLAQKFASKINRAPCK